MDKSIRTEQLDRAALTIPVHFPPKARQRLQQACAKAGIEVTHFFFEPIAAIYCSLVASPVSGVTAVFDWGGGSLDIATVQIEDGVAMTRQIEGWHRGGTDFDRLVAIEALNDFLLANPQPGITAELILDRMRPGRSLNLRVEEMKIQLSRQPKASLSYGGFLGGANLDYQLNREQFDELIAPDVKSAAARLEQVIKSTGITPRLLARLFLSGGTCNIPYVRDQLVGQLVGDRITDRLELPQTPGRWSSGGQRPRPRRHRQRHGARGGAPCR